MKSSIFKITAILLILHTSACAFLNKHVKKPSIEFQDVQLREIDLKGATLDFKYRLHNPNRIGLPIQAFRYELSINGTTLLLGETAQGVSIPGRGSTDLSLPLGIKFDNDIKKVFDGEGDEYQLRGEIDFGVIKVPFSKTGHFNLPKLPGISFSRIKLNKLRINEVSFTLRLNIKNSNAFAFNLNKLDYNLKLDGGSFIRGQSNNRVNIAANKTQTVDLNISLDLNQIKHVYRRFSAGGEMPIQFTGNIELDGFLGKNTKLPVDWSGSVGIR